MKISFTVTTEWDDEKARTNAAKHGITFEEAASVFYDALAITAFDAAHSHVEERWNTIGCSRDGRPVFVAHTIREVTANAVEVRIISARKPTNSELRQYEDTP